MTHRRQGRNQRAGRRNRNELLGRRVPKLGHYLIVTDAKETEKNYFNGLKNCIPDELKGRIVIQVAKAKTTEDLVERTIELREEQAQYCRSWIVADRDEVKDFDQLMSQAEACGINVGWSNPCFEIWLYAYFGMMPVFHNSQQCIREFAKKFEKQSSQRYEKNDKDIYRKINKYGDFKTALETAKQKQTKCLYDKLKPSQSNPASMVYILVEEIQSRAGLR